ncbi:MAG TPA: IPT/TIG domain-containing protein [Thermoanaerobaculia bacterium]|nr:IPT/TIG domain-containing protein [Thermoanaerobaculia bacterium]
MMKIRQRKSLFALLAVLALFAACKGESPTAPPVTPPGGGTGTTTPPAGATITLSASNPTPLVSSTTVITATVSQSGQPVPNGTAVEFRTNLGNFTDVSSTVTLRTTTGGVATATLTSASPGTATIEVIVGNVSRTITVTFQSAPVTPPPPDTAPSVTNMTPTTGSPAGGTVVTVTGRNFRAPVRVVLDLGGGVTREALVVPGSLNANSFQFVTPAIDLGTGQTKTAAVAFIFEAGSPSETRVTAPSEFTYARETMTPKVNAVSPASGPVSGGTRVTIFGDGFQAPVQVFFGSAEAQVINVTFTQIVVISPVARDTASDGSGVVTGPVAIRVRNINSGTEVTFPGGFRYTPKMQITAAAPTRGPATGGTRVTIDGSGFDDPVAVSIGGIAAQPISVTGSQIVAITSPALSPCEGGEGEITVTNVGNGDSATGPNFTYAPSVPVILAVAPANPIAGQPNDTVMAGQNLSIRVANPGNGIVQFKLGTRTVNPTGASVNADGSVTYTVPVPSSFAFTASTPCVTGSGAAGTQQTPVPADVTFTNVTTACSTTLASAVTIFPAGSTVVGGVLTPPCIALPPPTGAVSSSGSCTTPASCATTSAVSATGTATGTATITITNTAPAGSQSLTVSGTFSPQTNVTSGTITPASATIAPGGSQAFTIAVDPTAAGAFCANVTWTSNSSTAIPGSCVTGTATP